MERWQKATKCLNCGKIYAHGIAEYCTGCGTKIAKKNYLLELLGSKECMTLTENAVTIVARRKWFKWVEK